jgi:hypothetical protein
MTFKKLSTILRDVNLIRAFIPLEKRGGNKVNEKQKKEAL